jgi:hypothetical protein
MTHRFPRPYWYPGTSWFNLPVTKDVQLAPSAGTLDAAAAAEYGRVGVPDSRRIQFAHLHQDVDGNSGTTSLEMYRRRGGTVTQIASVSLAHGSGDFNSALWTFASESARLLIRGDYLHMQATAKMGGTPIGFVDVHWDSVEGLN